MSSRAAPSAGAQTRSLARAAALLAALLPACGGRTSPTTPPATDGPLSVPAEIAGDWPVARPEDVGLDTAALTAAVNGVRAGRQGALHSLLVLRRGRLCVEEYFAGSSRDDVHTLQSVTKSVTSLLLGIALDQGRIASVREPVLGFFPEYPELRGQDARKDALTLDDLLTMRSGLLWNEEPYAGSDLQRLNDSRGDWVRFVLEHPMREDPGTRWQYNSGGVIVLAGVLRRATGEDVTQYARRVLFEPLGIRGERWFRSPYDGLPHTGGGLSLRARDLARLGEMVRRGGRAGATQVVSGAWLDGSFARAAGPIAWPRPVYYGRLWWLFPPSGPATTDVPTASGAGGQWIFVVPPLELVVVSTADQNNPRFFSATDILFDTILTAVRD